MNINFKINLIYLSLYLINIYNWLNKNYTFGNCNSRMTALFVGSRALDIQELDKKRNCIQ